MDGMKLVNGTVRKYALGDVIVGGLTLIENECVRINGLSLTVQAGEIVGLVGRHGAGKSTCLGLIAGQITPTFGILRICGMTVRATSSRIPVGTNFHYPGSDATVSGLQWLARRGSQGWPAELATERAGRALAWLGLASRAHALLDQYDPEERSLLALAAAAIAEPSVIIADEPLRGLSEERAEAARFFLREQSDAGVAVLISVDPHDLYSTDYDRLYYLDGGLITARTTSQDLLAYGPVNERVMRSGGEQGGSR